MPGKLIRKTIEELCAAVVVADARDGKALAGIATRLDLINRWAGKRGHAEIERSTRRACGLVRGMIEGRITGADAEVSLDSVGSVVSAVQRTLLERPEGDSGCAPGPPLVDAHLVSGFVDAQREVLERLERLARGPESPEGESRSEQLRRLFHTLKGESAFLDLKDVERLCRAAENFVQETPADAAGDILLKVRDWLARAFDACTGKGSAPEPVDGLLGLMAPPASREDPRDASAPDAPPSAGGGSRKPADSSFWGGDTSLLASFIAEAKEHLDTANVHLLTLETHPDDREALDAVFRAFHTIKGITGLLDLVDIKNLAHEVENLLAQARNGNLLMSGAPVDIVFESIELLKSMVNELADTLRTGRMPAGNDSLADHIKRIEAVATLAVGEGETRYQTLGGKLGDILVESGKISRDVVDTALSRQKTTSEKKKLGEILIKEMGISGKDIAHALRSQKKPLAVKEQIKVDHERLDSLVDSIGELVIAVSMVSQHARSTEGLSADLSRHMGHLEKITRELQDMGTSLRMVPVRPTFQKMALLVRDLARKAGKPVSFETSGEDTELDKNIVDKIGDPLTHLIRNAVDHGLEDTADERRRAGKGDAGRITLRAFHKGGNIWIEVEDDGRGFNREAIVAKAIERGLIRDGEDLSDREIWNLTLKPGFSTAEKVTEVSGRGVGLDVVARNVDSLRGEISIRSEEGRGSVCSIRLPLTLAIIDGMVVRAGNERYIIPALSVVRSVRPEPGAISRVLDRGEILSLQGGLIPIFRLGTLFDIEGVERDPGNAVVVIVENGGMLAGLLTDELLGKQQTVIKPLGDNLNGIAGIAGGAIMPDGQVGLILDVGELVRFAHAAA
ncbi:MAG: Hpt domain-containing protein [Gemmatimonadota bacterium]